MSVVIVGAGLAGLVAARELRSHRDVVVVDKGRSVGGRLATRRIGDATLDHGAQFFTVRGDDFRETVAEAVEEGIAYEWCRGFAEPPDGYPRYAAHHGMNRLAKWLADGSDVMVDTEIESMAAADGRWTLRHAGGALEASTVIMTPPVPQSLGLVGPQLPGDVRDRLRPIRYHPTLAVLAVLDRPSAIPEPGARQLDAGPFTWVADNRRKGISASPAVTLHADHDLSALLYDAPEAEVLERLLAEAKPWLGGAEVVEAELKRWRYAGPVECHPEPTVSASVEGATVIFAGDAFDGPKVEGAFRSGLAAASAALGEDP